MGLTWTIVAIGGCVGLALCLAVALLRPMDSGRRRLRPLANADRLTRLPGYKRVARRRTTAVIATIVLLVVAFGASIVMAARPTGLPSRTTESATNEPEDVMLCIGEPVAGSATRAALGYFAEHVTDFGTQRIGLTSSNRRVIPLTRDYQYAKKLFASYAQPATGRSDLADFTAPVSYADYTESVEDLLALCLTGFPKFDRPAGQRRSLIYVGPAAPQGADGQGADKLGPTLFTNERLSTMMTAAGIQVNALVTGAESGVLGALASATGGMSFTANSDVSAHIAAIRASPPASTSRAAASIAEPTDTPDVPLVVGLLAVAGLAIWPVAVRR